MTRSESSPGPEAGADPRWPHWVNAFLGLWLVSSPSSLGYSGAMRTSDVVTGWIVVALALASLRYGAARWAVALLGVWLMLAPLVFWATAPAAYDNDTIIGMLLVAFAVLVPARAGKGEKPPGWSYNPSSYIQRAPIIAFAFVSYLIARHLTAYQLGYIAAPWDPFFGDGTRSVLDSEVSKSFPVSDAGLGAVSYLVEALSGFMGDQRRWRTMPWMVVLFGVLIVPLGVVSIALVVLQPVAVGAWCTLCLATAVLMLLMVSPAFDEIVATAQFLQRARREGRPFWRTFFAGDQRPATEQEDSRESLADVVGFARAPWTLVACVLLGAWLMASPALFGQVGAAAGSSFVAGPLVVTFAVIAMAEVARPSRWLVAAIGVWLVASPWVVGAHWSSLPVGLALVALAIPRGHVTGRCGGWESFMK
jgi:hypothetical protein